MSKVRQLHIIKIQRKDSKKSPEIHQNFSEEEKKQETIISSQKI